MVLKIHARLKDGILIPLAPLDLPDQDDILVTLTSPENVSPRQQMRDDPNDPCPEEGVALLDWFSRHRIKLDPTILRGIIDSKEYLDQDFDDEP